MAMSYDRLSAGNEGAHVHFHLQALSTHPSMLHRGFTLLSGANEAPSKAFKNDTLFVSNGSHGHEL